MHNSNTERSTSTKLATLKLRGALLQLLSEKERETIKEEVRYLNGFFSKHSNNSNSKSRAKSVNEKGRSLATNGAWQRRLAWLIKVNCCPQRGRRRARCRVVSSSCVRNFSTDNFSWRNSPSTNVTKVNTQLMLQQTAKSSLRKTITNSSTQQAT